MSTRHSSILLITLILSISVTAQERQWRQGSLTYSDFRIVDTVAQVHSFLDVGIKTTTQVVKYGRLYTGYPSAVAYFNPQNSWMDSSHRDSWELRYNQVIFDMTEVHRRKLQQRLDTSANAEAAMEAMYGLVDDINFFNEESNYGADTAAITYFEYIVWDILDSLPIESIEKHLLRDDFGPDSYEPDPSSCGVWLDGIGRLPFGQLNDYFRGGGGVALGARFGYKRHFFDFEAVLSGSECLRFAENTDITCNDLYADDPLTHPEFNLAYGFNAIDKLSFRLAPYAGFSLQGYYYDYDENQHYGTSSLAILAGIDLCWFFDINMYDLMLSRCGVHTRLFAAYNQCRDIVSQPSGWTLGFQLGIAAFSSEVHRK